MGKKVEKTHAGGVWTKSRYFTFIRSALRSAWLKYPLRFKAIKDATRDYSGENPRQKKETQCAVCKEWFPQSKIQVDHIDPCGSLTEYDHLPEFVEKLIPPFSGDNIQVLCLECHAAKTLKERTKNIT